MKHYIFSLASVLLATGGFAQMDTRDASSQAIADNFATFSSVQANGQAASTGTTILAFNHKEETKGSPYLFNRWVKGTAINSSNATVDQKGYLYNYDKLNHTLLLNVEGKYMVNVSNEDVKSFTLQGGDDGEMTFERINDVVIDGSPFFQVLVKGDAGKYSLYKMTRTKFVKADYHTDGMVESGNPYDQYVDTDDYFLLMPDGKTLKLMPMKVKTMKETVAVGNQKMLDFLKEHRYDSVDAAFLKQMTLYINAN
ncbi:MAG TPA: hypothetical protein VL547_11600 [Dinghuibacter sp.]|uniref:hypothetical protein n=1 Tax=Dinghuibacter sp. TaxID=2024697 RepID=UPI002C73EE05|nr:hypothetical protein [Dinghuibacter sp.]HTJ12666.1 hypothetical protein [Dinghuibacter sp.]